MQTLKIMSVVGARPNFMKIAPFAHAIAAHNERQKSATSNLKPHASNQSSNIFIEHFLVHTGQHYDKAMSESFFESLNIPHPDVDLGIGSGSHAEQVGRTMIEFEKVLLEQKPDWLPTAFPTCRLHPMNLPMRIYEKKDTARSRLNLSVTS